MGNQNFPGMLIVGQRGDKLLLPFSVSLEESFDKDQLYNTQFGYRDLSDREIFAFIVYIFPTGIPSR